MHVTLYTLFVLYLELFCMSFIMIYQEQRCYLAVTDEENNCRRRLKGTVDAIAGGTEETVLQPRIELGFSRLNNRFI
jgi:hypothetical protein